MSNKQRTFKIFKYLWNNTDEEHPATIKEILKYLEKKRGSKATGKLLPMMFLNFRTPVLMSFATESVRTSILSAAEHWNCRKLR